MEHIKKIVAYNPLSCDDARKVIPSSEEEMHKFIVECIRPEFNDPFVTCVKFVTSISEDEETEDASSWFINPVDRMNVFCSAYGPKMAGTFLPEILLIDNDDMEDVLRKYNAFHNIMLFEGNIIPEEEKFDKFMEMYDELD